MNLKDDPSIDGAQFGPNGRRIVTVSRYNARLWDAQTGQPLTSPLRPLTDPSLVSFSPDGERIVVACWTGTWVLDGKRELILDQVNGWLKEATKSSSANCSSLASLIEELKGELNKLK